MDSSKYIPIPNDYLYDPVRKLSVKKSPEELVRQQLLTFLSEDLGYPLPFFSIEKSLASLQTLYLTTHKQPPERRIDLLISLPVHQQSFSLQMTPFLIAECKQSHLNSQAEQQLISYNFFVKAPLLLLTNGKETKIGRFDKNKKIFVFLPGFPPHFKEVQTFLKKKKP